MSVYGDGVIRIAAVLDSDFSNTPADRTFLPRLNTPCEELMYYYDLANPDDPLPPSNESSYEGNKSYVEGTAALHLNANRYYIDEEDTSYITGISGEWDVTWWDYYARPAVPTDEDWAPIGLVGTFKQNIDASLRSVGFLVTDRSGSLSFSLTAKQILCDQTDLPSVSTRALDTALTAERTLDPTKNVILDIFSPFGYAYSGADDLIPQPGVDNPIILTYPALQDTTIWETDPIGDAFDSCPLRIRDWVGPGDHGDDDFGGGCKLDDDAFTLEVTDFLNGEGLLMCTDGDSEAFILSQLGALFVAEDIPASLFDGQTFSAGLLNSGGQVANLTVKYPTLAEDVTGLAFRADLDTYSYVADETYANISGIVQIIAGAEAIVTQFFEDTPPAKMGISLRSVAAIILPMPVDSAGRRWMLDAFSEASTPIRMLGGSFSVEVWPTRDTCLVSEGGDYELPEYPVNPAPDSSIDLGTPILIGEYRAEFEPRFAETLRQEGAVEVVNPFIANIRLALTAALDKPEGNGRSLPLDMNGYKIKQLTLPLYKNSLLKVGDIYE